MNDLTRAIVSEISRRGGQPYIVVDMYSADLPQCQNWDHLVEKYREILDERDYGDGYSQSGRENSDK